MKKTFLKASFFSLMLGALPVVTLTGCKDYDSDIDSLTQRDDTMQKEINDKLAQQSEALGNQISALETALEDLDAEAARATAAAKTAADAAQATADQAEANAQAANAKALAAEAAAAQAKADAVKETLGQLQTLQNTVNGQISDLEEKYGNDYKELSAALAKAATSDDLNSAVSKLEAAISASTLSQADIENMLATQLSQINTNTTSISALSGRIDGIDTQYNTLKTQSDAATAQLNTIVTTTIPGIDSKITALDTKLSADISSLNNLLTTANTQISALENFKSTYESLLQNLNGIDFSDIQTRLTSAETKLTAAQADILKNAGDITTINGLITALQSKDTDLESQISAINGTIQSAQQDIIKINSALSTLSSSLSKRLTSVTLVPTSYVGGIPTIEFYSASFTPMGAATDGIYAAPAANAQAKIITNNDTQVLYRLSPAGVALTDIVADDVTFVQQTAASRAAETPVIKVVGVDKDEDGIFVVTATKNDGVTGTIDNAGEGKIYTVALKVPVAPKNYFSWTENGQTVTESAEDAVVYSEYCRLSESTFVPEIAQAESSPITHFSDASIWTATDVDPVAEVSFVSEGYDLSELVTGCMTNADGTEHKLMTAAQLESFGFTFEFSVPTKAYTVDGINQQLYASVTSAGILTPTQPASLTSASRVGKTPIISVVMKYGNDVVDQRFFKVEYTIDAQETTKEIDVFTKELSCGDITAYVTWDAFIKAVVDELPFDMNKAEFIANYSTVGTDGVTVDATATTNYITWTVEAWETGNLGGKDKTLTKELTYTSTTGFPDVTVKLNGTIQWPSTLPALGKTSVSYWNAGVMRILPNAMPEGNPDGVTATYNTNILIGRTAPYLTDLLNCALWDIKVKSAPTGFTVGGDNDYAVLQGDNTAASIWYDATDHEPMSLGVSDANGALKEMFFYIENNEAGIELVENEGTVSLGWYIYLNGLEVNDGTDYYNEYVLNNTNLQIIKPLTSVNTADGLSLTQDAKVQTLNLAEGMTFTDCFGNTFDKEDLYYKYYDITDVKWLNDMTITEADGSIRTLEELHLTAMVDETSGELTFTGNGIALNQQQVLNVPVEVTHKWGVLKSTVKVTIVPKL